MTKTCDTVLDGITYTATCEDGVTTITNGYGETVVSFKDPRALASAEGPLVMLVKLYLKGRADQAAQHD